MIISPLDLRPINIRILSLIPKELNICIVRNLTRLRVSSYICREDNILVLYFSTSSAMPSDRVTLSSSLCSSLNLFRSPPACLLQASLASFCLLQLRRAMSRFRGNLSTCVLSCSMRLNQNVYFSAVKVSFRSGQSNVLLSVSAFSFRILILSAMSSQSSLDMSLVDLLFDDPVLRVCML